MMTMTIVGMQFAVIAAVAAVNSDTVHQPDAWRRPAEMVQSPVSVSHLYTAHKKVMGASVLHR